ncbi:MAG TPA: YciI family protein [Acidimicrobiales bacterium]
MKYMLMIYGSEELWSSLEPDAIARLTTETDALTKELYETGELIGAYGVDQQANAKVVRVRDGVPAVTDGPYIETKEYLGSFMIVDCESEERALDIAARNPASMLQVEVRAIMHEAAPEV